MAQIPDHFGAVRAALVGYICPADEPNPWDALRSIKWLIREQRRQLDTLEAENRDLLQQVAHLRDKLARL